MAIAVDWIQNHLLGSISSGIEKKHIIEVNPYLRLVGVVRLMQDTQ